MPDILKYVDAQAVDFTLNYVDPAGYYEVPVAAGKYKGRKIALTFLQRAAGRRLLVTVTVEDINAVASGLLLRKRSDLVQPYAPKGGRL